MGKFFFLTLGGIEKGYTKNDITPYIHIMCYHVLYFLSSCGLERFTGQGVEKTNDVIRRLYHLKSNKFDACKDGLQAVKRLDDLQGFERKPRNYSQHDTQYWTTGILEERRKRPRLSVVPREDEMTICSTENTQFYCLLFFLPNIIKTIYNNNLALPLPRPKPLPSSCKGPPRQYAKKM